MAGKLPVIGFFRLPLQRQSALMCIFLKIVLQKEGILDIIYNV